MSRPGIVLEVLARLRRLKQAAGRAEARIHFALGRRARQAPLSDGQILQYQRAGYLLVSGLVPQHLAAEGDAAMWERLGADSQSPASWTLLGPRPHVLKDERFAATYTEEMLAAAAQLAGEDVAGFRRPTHAFTINNVPVGREWQPHPPHLDQMIPALRLRTFPRPYWIGAITYLTDVGRHGGGTIVWPRSHFKLEALARADPGKYKYLFSLGADLARFELGPPVELTPSRGDVLFFHYLCVHASSDNVSGTPRLAIAHKW